MTSNKASCQPNDCQNRWVFKRCLKVASSWSTRVQQSTGWTRNPATSTRSDLARRWTATSTHLPWRRIPDKTTTTSGRDCREPYMIWSAMASWSVWKRSGDPPPRECSAAAAAFIIIELNVLLVIITKIHYHCPSSHLAYSSCCSCLGTSLLSKYSILAVVRLLLCIYISLCTLILYRTMHIVDIRDSFECIDYTAQCWHRNEIKCCADGFVNIVMHML